MNTDRTNVNVLYCIVLHSLPIVVLYYIVLNVLHCIALYCIVLNCTALHCINVFYYLYCNALHVLYCDASYCILPSLSTGRLVSTCQSLVHSHPTGHSVSDVFFKGSPRCNRNLR